VNWPAGPRGSVDAFFVEFHPAILEWPVDPVEGKEITSQARLTAYERDGTPFAYGTCRRTMRVAAHESIRSGEQTFEDAVRMEADTDLAFGWMATIRVHETAWFARGVGLVRREERFSGRALWLFHFGGAARYELAQPMAPRAELLAGQSDMTGVPSSDDQEAKFELVRGATGLPADQPNMLARVAASFDRTGRRVRLLGMAAEWDQPAAKSGVQASAATQADGR
jgi:hypothetical protein